MMTPEIAREIFLYNPETGLLYWQKPCNYKTKLGDIAGRNNKSAYKKVGYNYREYQVTTIIWLIIHGRVPNDRIDHINGNPSDNRLSNLRECRGSQNSMNRGPDARNKTGIKGVFWDGIRRKYLANIMQHGRTIHIGRYNSLEEAAAARKTKEIELFGEFSH